MKSSICVLSGSQIKALLRKDVLVRWRQPWMSVIQIVWPCLIFLLLYLIRLKFGPEHIEDCQFPTRMFPTKNNVLPGFYSYICSIENKCMNTTEYEEYSKMENAPMKPIIDIVQTFINHDGMFNAIIDLPEKANFISAITSIVTGGHMDEIRMNIEKVMGFIPQVEKMLNGTFDIKKLFSDRQTFVKSGYLLCGSPFPSAESIPLVNDILYSEDFSEVNDDELKAMPTKYCKRLYLDVTSTNHGKLTWNAIKPIIHGKILYAPDNNETRSIMQFSNSTFEELNRLKMFSVAVEQILTKLHHDEEFQKKFDSVLKLAQTPIVRSLVGDDIDLDQIEAVIQRLRTDPVVYDVVTTIKNLLECFTVDRFMPYETEDELRKSAFELNHQRLFYAAVYFNKTTDPDVVYKFHMDTDNTQPTFENKNRFWFPGPSRNMIRDMKYHRGFAQIKHSLDLGIIKHKKQLLRDSGAITEAPIVSTENPFKVEIFTGNGGDEDEDDEDDDDWFTGGSSNKTTNSTKPSNSNNSDLVTDFVSGFENLMDNDPKNNESTMITTMRPERLNTTADSNDNDDQIDLSTEKSFEHITTNVSDKLLDDMDLLQTDMAENSHRQKRQSLLELFGGFSNTKKEPQYDVDNLKYFSKQFPYPAYIHDDFKTGLYLAQAIQVAFFLGLVAEIASCVRHHIWMRESRNTMIMRSMGLKPSSELLSWLVITHSELFLIFVAVLIILYTGGILVYTTWIFVLVFLLIFGACLVAFCYMCSTFFTSATIGAVATAILFFITFCPYIAVLLFDAHLTSLQNFAINLSFTSAFSHAWGHIMRMELQQIGLSYVEVFREGLHGDFGFGVFMIIIDMLIYIAIGCIYEHFKNDEFRFIEVQRDDLDANVGATLTNVSKIYDNDKIAVSNINLSFPKNQVTCLLGRNGAGKSTIIKMLTGQVVQTTGRVILSQAMASIDDYDKIGVCSQDNILIPNLTAREHLEMYAKIKLKNNYEDEVRKTLKNLNFGKHESYQAAKLSGGYQRRLCVAIAFIGSPNVVILDEPCNGVDNKARKDIWELIERLRKGRAVVFATHFLDEAEYLSDAIVIMKNGKLIAKHNVESLKEHCTVNYEVSMECCDLVASEEIISSAGNLLINYKVLEKSSPFDLRIQIAYDQPGNKSAEFLAYLHELQQKCRISALSIETQNLEQLFRDLDRDHTSMSNGHTVDVMKPIQLKKENGMDLARESPLTRCEAVRELFWKRLVHFSRNYRMLICVLLLPALFELLAMWIVKYRLEDDFDRTISFKRDLYPNTMEMLSMEKGTNFTNAVYKNLKAECSSERPCREFSNSKDAFYWILKTTNDYQGKRYGGYSFNDTKTVVWYNNKGYHAMMAWLNDLNTQLFQTEMNDTDYSITAYNEPWKLGYGELSTSSILRQAGDSCMAFILLIAFSLVVAVATVYLVNERMKGEKLQQRLCGVDAGTYWGVAFVWDFMIMILAILVCTSIILAFNMPVFTDRQQIWGIIALALLYGFACIPAIHVFEKCFTDSSMAIVTIFCNNLIIPMFTMSIIVLLGVIGDSPAWDDWRYTLNRVFLIFPQHALGDGLLEITKNYVVAQVFRRYDIDSYKNPVNSDLLRPHFISLVVLGCFFAILNVLIESGLMHRAREYWYGLFDCAHTSEKKHLEELKIVSIQNSLKRMEKYDTPQVLKVDNLCKTYTRNGPYAVKNVTFAVKSGECFGLLGKNGAGKSTIFKMLSGEIQPSLGEINYFNHEISYCPQTNTLDALLTVKECIEFYGRLRRIKDITKFTESILESYQLGSYRDVLVKNLSGGNRRKLTVATTCCGRTAVVLMDEPTSDMDPVTRAIVYRTIHQLLAEQRAIVLTSHSISEIDEICHRIGVLKDGHMLTCSSPESLKAQYGGYYNVAVFCDPDTIDEVAKVIPQRFPQCVDVQIYSHSIKFGIKIDMLKEATNRHEMLGVNENRNITITLAELFTEMNTLSREYPHSLRYAINRCRLDAIFERILDNSENSLLYNGCDGTLKSPALAGSAATGYIHNGYIETETIT